MRVVDLRRLEVLRSLPSGAHEVGCVHLAKKVISFVPFVVLSRQGEYQKVVTAPTNSTKNFGIKRIILFVT